MIAYLAAVFNSLTFDFLIRTRVSANLNFFYIYQTPVPSQVYGGLADEIVRLSGMLSSADERFEEFANTLGIKISPIDMKERIELTAKLNALVAKHYGLSHEELIAVLNSFEGFEEEKELDRKQGEIHWTGKLIKEFNGEVRRRVVTYFEDLEIQRGERR